MPVWWVPELAVVPASRHFPGLAVQPHFGGESVTFLVRLQDSGVEFLRIPGRGERLSGAALEMGEKDPLRRAFGARFMHARIGEFDERVIVGADQAAIGEPRPETELGYPLFGSHGGPRMGDKSRVSEIGCR